MVCDRGRLRQKPDPRRGASRERARKSAASLEPLSPHLVCAGAAEAIEFYSHAFGGKYLELAPHERIRYSDKFDDPNLAGEMTTTVDLKKVPVGTEVNIVQAGIPD